MQAVIETGSKQYLVTVGDKVTVEKLVTEPGDILTFDNVLLVVADDSSVKLGKPYVAGAKVTGKVLAQQRGQKLTVFKYRAKSRYRRKSGHRQSETVVQIQNIS